jgi:hypothetical protein
MVPQLNEDARHVRELISGVSMRLSPAYIAT